MLLKIGDTVQRKDGQKFSNGEDTAVIIDLIKEDPLQDHADLVQINTGYTVYPHEIVVIGSTYSEPVAEAALRYNEGKPRLHWLDAWPKALQEVTRPFDFGEVKYGAYNYKKGAPYSESYDCARRHMMKWFNGEEYDLDTFEQTGEKVNHLAFAAWNILRLLDEVLEPGQGTKDDRPQTFLNK